MKRPDGGTVLLQVLVTAIMVMIIAAGLVRMVLMRYHIVQRGQDSAVGKRYTEGAYNQLLSNWNQTNTYCLSTAGYSCSPAPNIPPNNCTCTCTRTGYPTVSAGGGAAAWPRCTLTIAF